MVDSSPQRRFRFSIRTLMIALPSAPSCSRRFSGRFTTSGCSHGGEEGRGGGVERQARSGRRPALRCLLKPAGGEPASRPSTSASGVPTRRRQEPGLWAALSVNHSVFAADEVKDLVVEFTIVNDGLQPIDPGIAGSRLMINGKELRDSTPFLAMVPAMPASPPCRPAIISGSRPDSGDHFQAPGTYRVSWRGDAFQAPEISFRVLPARVP